MENETKNYIKYTSSMQPSGFEEKSGGYFDFYENT